jgi:hypothetical protein
MSAKHRFSNSLKTRLTIQAEADAFHEALVRIVRDVLAQEGLIDRRRTRRPVSTYQDLLDISYTAARKLEEGQ